MNKNLAIIGASYLQLPLIEKAKKMGYTTHVFAWAANDVGEKAADRFYPISVKEVDAITEKCREIGICGICSIATDFGNYAVNYIADKLGLPGNSMDCTLKSTNKHLMRKAFEENGDPSPYSVIVDENTDLSAIKLTYPIIVKPTDRSGSRGVEKVENVSGVSKALERACSESFQKKAIIEEFVDGREISVESISFAGQHYVLQITDKVTTEAPFFVELEHHQPSSLPEDIKSQVKKIVLHALDALHIQYGASHSELKITEDKDIRVIEIGARMGGDFIGSDLVKLSTGYDFLKGVIEVALGDFHEPVITEHQYSGVYFLSKETERLKPIIENWQSHPEIVEAEVTNNELRHIECSGDRSGYLIYKSKESKVIF